MTKYFVIPTRDDNLFRQEVMSTFTHPDSGDVFVVYLDEEYFDRPVTFVNFTEMLRLGYKAWVVEEQVVDVLG